MIGDAKENMKQRHTTPWERKAPGGSRKTKLTPTSKAKAKAAAKKAGRGYPNLVDNMNAAKKQRTRAADRRTKKRP